MARVLCFIVMIVFANASFASEQSASDPRITWKTISGPCYGLCRSTEITVRYDGRVLIEQVQCRGECEARQTTRRDVRVSPSALARFRDRLARFRPTGGEPQSCPAGIQDLGYILVEWNDERGRAFEVSDSSCDPKIAAEMRMAFETAPALLEISDLHIPELER